MVICNIIGITISLYATKSKPAGYIYTDVAGCMQASGGGIPH